MSNELLITALNVFFFLSFTLLRLSILYIVILYIEDV